MTYGEALGASLLRSLFVALLGTPVAWGLARHLETLPLSRRPLAWGVVLLPFCTPSLVTGYCYRDTSLALVHLPWAREAIYAFIVLAQSVPLGVLLIRFAPSPSVSDSAWHLRRMAVRFGIREKWRLLVRSRAGATLYAFAALFVFAFQEADLASLLQAATWSEWLFTRHAQGLDPWTSARLASVPVLLQFPWILVLLGWASPDREIEERMRRPVRQGPWIGALCRCWGTAALLAVCIVPAVQLWRGARQGWPALLGQPSTWRELQDSIVLSVTAGGVCYWIARSRTRTPRDRLGRLFPLLCSAGLMGNLSLGLILAAIFQTPLLRVAYDTPIPLIVGEILFLLPRMLVLMHGVSRFSDSSSLFLIDVWGRDARRRRDAPFRQLRWRESVGPAFALFLIGCGWIYLEVMLPSLLTMPGMVPVGLILYNSLHYGRISALGAKLTLALLVPLVVAATVPIVRGGRPFRRSP